MTETTPTQPSYSPKPIGATPEPNRVLLDVPARVVVKVLFIIALFWLASSALVQLSGLLIQISIAAFLAVAADPIVRRMARRGVARGRAVVIVMLASFGVLGIIIAMFVPPLVEQAGKLIDATPSIIDDITKSGWYEQVDERFGIVQTLSEQAEKLPAEVSDQIGNVLSGVASGLFGTITIIFLTIFLLLGGGQLVQGTVRVFPLLAERRWWTIVQGAYTGIAAYVGGAIVIAFIGGSVVTVSALILGLPYALPLGIWMGLLEIIPMIGATIGAIPAVIVAFAVGGTVEGIAMIIIVVVYQQFENIYVQPRVQGKAASLTPLIVFLAVLIGSQLLGVLGALFAVPVAGVIQIFIRQIIDERGNGSLVMPPLRPDDLPLAPDVDQDGQPGVAGPNGDQT
ncbi:MAG: AI-2E family transporter [Gaiellales bacterium]